MSLYSGCSLHRRKLFSPGLGLSMGCFKEFSHICIVLRLELNKGSLRRGRGLFCCQCCRTRRSLCLGLGFLGGCVFRRKNFHPIGFSREGFVEKGHTLALGCKLRVCISQPLDCFDLSLLCGFTDTPLLRHQLGAATSFLCQRLPQLLSAFLLSIQQRF